MSNFCLNGSILRRRFCCLLLIVLCLGSFFSAFALIPSDQLIETLKPQGLVSDYAGVFSSREKSELTAQLNGLRQTTGIEVAVVALDSLRGGQLEDFATRLYEKWGIGQKGRDNGVLLLAVIQDRKMRIEVGYGLEGVLTDAEAGRIRDADIIPYFKQNKYAMGLTRGALAIAEQVADGEFYAKKIPPQVKKKAKPNVLVRLLVFAVFIVIFIKNPFLAMLLLSGGRGGGGQSGGFGGGFGGFGGGMSGGGGASGSW